MGSSLNNASELWSGRVAATFNESNVEYENRPTGSHSIKSEYVIAKNGKCSKKDVITIKLLTIIEKFQEDIFQKSL